MPAMSPPPQAPVLAGTVGCVHLGTEALLETHGTAELPQTCRAQLPAPV